MQQRSPLRFTAALVLAVVTTAGTATAAKPTLTAPAADHTMLPAPGSRLLVLAIGINAYPAKERLHYAVRDARELVQVLRDKAGRSFSKVETRLLIDKEADRARILDGFAWLKQETTPHDLAVIFYSGHGGKDAKLGFFLVPFGFRDGRPQETMISGKELKEAAAAVPGPTLVLLDCCHAGAVLNESGPADPKRAAASTDRPGPVFLCASRGRELSEETNQLKHGTFTKALLEALSGKADANHDGAVSLEEVQTYVRKRVKRLSQDEQHLVVGGSGVPKGITLTRP